MSTDGRVGGSAQVSCELWFVAPKAVELRRVELPCPVDDEVLVRGICSGVSQGTELLLYRGEGPARFDPSLDAPGQTTYPRRYGYAWVGEVVAPGNGSQQTASSLPVGARVLAFAPHGDFHVLRAASLSRLDPNIPPERAVLSPNLEAAVTCVWDAGISLGDRVVVLGGGIVGQLVAWLAQSAGAQVRLVEPSTRRREAAQALGVQQVLSPEQDVPAGSADVVIEATGDPQLLDRAIAHAGLEAAVVVASFYGARVAPVSLGADFHRKRLSLKSTQVSRLPATHQARWTRARRFDLVRSLLTRPELDALLDAPVPFERAVERYQQIDQAPSECLQTVFRYSR